MKNTYKIGVIPGDGIGRDAIRAAQIVLDTIGDLAQNYSLEFKPMVTGDSAYEKYDDPFPEITKNGIAQTDAVLFGAAGNPHTQDVLMGFRLGFNLYANVRPIKALPGSNALREKADFIIVRENTEGLYKGTGYIYDDTYVNLRIFTDKGMERILRFCFELARKKGRKKVTFTHKAHVLTYTDEPMRQLFYKLANEYPDVEAEDMTIDACAMQIVMHPERFDIVFAENANGDVLSDVGAGVVGGMGFAYSGNIGDAMGVFEPIHGTAPKYADKNVINPIAAIMAARMMFDYLDEISTGDLIEKSIVDVLTEGKIRTYDLKGASSTSEVAGAISMALKNNWRHKPPA